MKSTKLLALVAVGLALTMFARSKKGKELVEDITEGAEDLAETLGDYVGRMGGKLSSLKSILAEEVEGLADDTRDKMRALLEEGQSASKKLAKKAKESFN